ncbi:MAG: hypothetical protein CMO80_18895 [Verrucomicrobiales bacterium]|nr:hypothetical protein [Verrucomicrobiales bacterium]
MACLVGMLGVIHMQGADREAIKFFERSIRPLLAANCYECHGPKKSKSGLRLDHRAGILKGGQSGPAILPGKASESLLIQAVLGTDPDFKMPPKKSLSNMAIADLKKWISMGAPWPEMAGKSEEVDEHGFTEEDRQWWAVQPVTKPTVPEVAGKWARNEIDRFVFNKLQEEGLKPAKEASREELIRRAYFDLLGLPPSPKQIAEFVQDKRPDAWQRLVRSLLDSPRYGERWAQHWLDVVRFAESDGYREDAFRPDAYRYRDYVIRSLNEDKPYDQFVREQLAGDELDPNDPDVFVGTGFLRHGIYEWNQRNARMHWGLIIDELTRVTGEVFLGIGIGCAQCHDHKFDPILQKDYYALQSFISTVEWPLESYFASPSEVRDYRAKLAKWEEQAKTVRAQMHAMLKASYDSKEKYMVKQFPADIQAIYHKPEADLTSYERQLRYLVERQVVRQQGTVKATTVFKSKPSQLKQYQALEAELKKLDHLKPKAPPSALVARDIDSVPTRTYIKSRTGKREVQPAFLTLLGHDTPAIEARANSTGRRTALADWITDPKNPLSTRVVVNRIWQRHFGKGIVATPNDFGRLGEIPSHPELLDWLTQQFLKGEWKFKNLHELILNSATYRQTARREPGNDESMRDPGNHLLWRYPPQRLDAEQIRDAMLTASAEIRHRVGGSSQSGTSTYRSVYVKKLRNKPDAVLNGFDAPAGFDSAPDRISTTTPLQSLLLINDDWILQRATALAKSVVQKKTYLSESDVSLLFQRVYGRSPHADEISGALEFVRAQSGDVTAPVAPEDKFPNETGLRPITQYFKNIKSPVLGEKALWIQPDSRFERLHLQDFDLAGGDFTIEAVAVLDRMYSDAKVSTLVSRWNNAHGSRGWSLGITSQRSSYQPRNFIMQLVGEELGGKVKYEVVPSNLRFPLGKPVYIAAAISTSKSVESRKPASVTFYMKELSDPKAKLQKAVVETIVRAKLQNSATKTLIGGRDSKSHQWDGQLARLAITRGALPESELLINKPSRDLQRLVNLSFNGTNGNKPTPASAWLPPAGTSSKAPSKLVMAVTDLCHAMLNSNEFLYLH